MASYFLTTACVCGLLLSVGHAQDPAAVPDTPLRSMFHCARLGISCDSEATCLPAIGLCDCPDGFEGYDCSVNSTLVEVDDCECKNGGTCVEDAGESYCYCPDAYYGEMCEEIRVSQTCHPDSIEMTVVPYADLDPFRGTIYVHNNPTDGCFLTDGSGTGLYTNTISFDACEGASTDTNADGDTEVSFSVLVQYMPNILTQYDQQFVFKCIIRKSDSLLEVPGNMVTNDEEQSPLDKQEVTGELVPVELTLVSADTGEEVTTPQGIGTDLKLRFTLNGGDVYDSFRVEKVIAHNGLDDPVEALDLVNDGCVTPEGGSVVTGFSGDPFTQVELPFTLFKFLHSGQVAFRVTVMLCQGTGGCNTTECDMYAGVGRKRRDVGEDDIILEEDEEDNTLERLDSPGVFVWIPGDEEGQQSGRLRPIDYPQKLTESAFSIHKPGLCFQNIWFIVCVVAIVMAFTLLGVLVAVLCLRRRRSSDKIESSPHNTYVTTPAGLDNNGFGSTKF